MDKPVFHFVASSGRTGTTYIAAVLDSIPGVAGCHEGYRGAAKEQEPLLPLVNLENRHAYNSPENALEVVRTKRSREMLLPAARQAGCDVLIDVAYYNATLARALLETHPSTRMVGIVRGCEAFVRSATILTGEDTLPVGWPHPDKPLTGRERFIQLGRLRPRAGSEEHAVWGQWSAVMRNVWLWRETNLLLCDAKEAHPDRVSLLRFESLTKDPARFWEILTRTFGVSVKDDDLTRLATGFRNARTGGYQIPSCERWHAGERRFLEQSAGIVESRLVGLGLPVD